MQFRVTCNLNTVECSACMSPTGTCSRRRSVNDHRFFGPSGIGVIYGRRASRFSVRLCRAGRCSIAGREKCPPGID